MARLWKEQRESDLARLGFVWTYAHYLTLIFHTLGRPDRLLSGVRTSFFLKSTLRIRLLRGHNYIFEYASTPSMGE
jgi:hypothetical protein